MQSDYNKRLTTGDFQCDEHIFKQYHMTTISWVAPDGSQLIVLKDDGQGLMITAFQFWVGDK